MKAIDLKKRTIYVDDIEQIYIDDSYTQERYFIQTIYGTYLVDKEDYYKVKDCLLSLNEEDKKIEKFTEYEIKRDMVTNTNIIYKINEIIDKISKGE